MRRARSAKSGKERHDNAYFAWEASVRLAVAARPPADCAPLALASLGKWVAALALDASSSADPALLAAFSHLTEVGLGRRAAPRSVAPRRLLDAVPAYRNAVIGHGAPREGAFYDRAAGALLEGIEAAWREGILGAPPALPCPPWVLEQESAVGPRTLFFNGRGRQAQYLDYLSGETLRGRALAAEFPEIEAEIERVFGARERVSAERGAPGDDGEPRDPDLFGEYRLLGALGAGGMGMVHLARQESLGRTVALKRLPPGLAADATALARFRREVRALARVDHPNVVKVLSSGEAQGVPYYAMERIEGKDLASLAPELLRAGDRTIAALFRDAARGLHALHEAGVVHRDVKPANIMLTDEDRRPVVMDLGLALLDDASCALTRERGALVGTLRYMAPEALEAPRRAGSGSGSGARKVGAGAALAGGAPGGRAAARPLDRRADVYALGATLYEIAAGRPIHDGESEPRLLAQVLRERPAPPRAVNPRLSPDLSTIIEKAIEKDPARRYATAEDLAQDLDAFLEGRPIRARPPALGYVLSLAVRRNRALAATALAAAGAIVLGSLVFLGREQRLRDVAEARESEARRALARLLVEKGERLLAQRDALGAHVLLAEALLHEDQPATRDRVVEARVRGARVEREVAVARSGLAPRLSRDGARLVMGGTSGDALRVLDLASGAVRALTIPEAASRVVSLGLLAEGRRAVTAHADGALREWDLDTGAARTVARLRAEPLEAVLDVASRAPLAACLTRDGVVSVIDVETGEARATFRPRAVGESGLLAATALALSPGGETLALAADGWTVELLDVRDPGRAARALPAPFGAQASRLVFSLDGRRLHAACFALLRAWDLEGETLAHSDPHHPPSFSIALSPGGRELLVGGAGTADLVDAASRRPLLSLRLPSTPADVAQLDLGPDGLVALSTSRRQGVTVLRAGRSREGRVLVRGEGSISDVALSADGSLLAVGEGGRRSVALRDGVTGALLRRLAGPAKLVASVCVRPDGARVAAGSLDGRVYVWDTASGALLHALEGHADAAYGTAWSPDGRFLASASQDCTVRLWDAEAGRPLRTLRGLSQPGWATRFTGDGRRVVAGGLDGVVRVFDVASGATLAAIPTPSTALGLALDEGERRVAVCGRDGVVRVFDVASGALQRELPGHEEWAGELAWLPGGRVLASAARDRSLRLWEVDAGRAISVLRAHDAPIAGARLDPPRGRLLTAGEDGTVIAWDLAALERMRAASPGEILEEAQRETGLTVEGGEAVAREGR